jgi:hypothetical protein
MPYERSRRLSIRISEEEWTMLNELAERARISASDWVRLKILDDYATSPPKKKR